MIRVPARVLVIKTPEGEQHYSLALLLEYHRLGKLPSDHPAWSELRRLNLLSKPN